MSQVKQIEEMANVLTYEIAWDEDEIPTVNCLETAKRLYNLGYRKQSEGEWVAKETMIRSPYARNCYCSECKYEPIEVKSYCPNCGAKMKGGTE